MKPIIYLDGRFMRADKKFLLSLTPGVLKAKGCFETMRVYQKKIFVYERHMRRMKAGLKRLHISPPISSAQLKTIVRTLLAMNKLNHARLRMMVWQKMKMVHTAVVVMPLDTPSAQKYKEGYVLCVSSTLLTKTRYSSFKTLDYQTMRRALQQARKKSCDEALLLNQKGFLVEGAHTNIFFVKDKILYTPALLAGCLDGVTRRLVIQSARKLGVTVREGQWKLQALLSADEAFITNTLLGIMPLNSINYQTKINFKTGSITHKLYSAYKRVFDSDISKQRLN